MSFLSPAPPRPVPVPDPPPVPEAPPPPALPGTAPTAFTPGKPGGAAAVGEGATGYGSTILTSPLGAKTKTAVGKALIGQ